MEDFEEIETPIVSYESPDLGRIALTWFNTKMLLFTESQYDHVRYYTEVPDKCYAFVPPTELSDALWENHYPTDYRPIVDDATRKWYLGSVALIFKEIDELFKDDQ